VVDRAEGAAGGSAYEVVAGNCEADSGAKRGPVGVGGREGAMTSNVTIGVEDTIGLGGAVGVGW